METRVAAVTVSCAVLVMLVLGSLAVMVTGPPPAMPVATPVLKPMAAILVLEEVQFTEVVIFCLMLSVYAAVSAISCLNPLPIEGLAGVTAIETRAAAV